MIIRLELYVTGNNIRSSRALAQAEVLRERIGADMVELEVINVFEDGARAAQARVLATPLLIKRTPPPSRRLVGEFSDVEELITLLDLPMSMTQEPEH